ncbi:MAG: glycosyltransferase, partial [Kineosporiaceae bacterium]
YSDDEYAADALAVMDAAGVDRAVLVALSCGVSWAVRVAAAQPDRVTGILAIAPACGLGVPDPERDTHSFHERSGVHDGWGMYNQHFLTGCDEDGYERFLRFFFGRMFTEAHSTKQVEDCITWGLDVGPRVLVDTVLGRLGCDGATCTPLEPLCRRLTCPVRVLHGTDDRIRTSAIGERLAELTGGTLLLVEGAGHGLPARDPVLVNREIRAFVDRVTGTGVARVRTAARSMRRRRRALFLSSPIGLGHARRDVAIAGELRRLHPDLQVDWLAQDPVTRLLQHHGERVHPASRHLANESAHIEDECADHDLHAFGAVRRMDEILVNNFMVFSELTTDEPYDLVVGDEAWEVDHFLHENPELKRAAFVWLTDFVGWLPMPDGGADEAALTADYNAEMIEHRARFPWLRDRSVFVGEADDVVDETFGAGLPRIRDWTRDNFDFAGYVSGLAPVDSDGRAGLRARLGYGDDEQVCLVAVGGSGVGLPLLRRVAAAVPAMRRRIAGLRVVMVTGPRIDPGAVPAVPGLEVVGFLPDLQRQLAACDVAVVQGGLSTTMELTANRRPFVYVPLRNHFEQSFHVRHRLERHRAGRCLDYTLAADPDALAEAVADRLGTEVDYRPVATDGAARVAALVADLL